MLVILLQFCCKKFATNYFATNAIEAILPNAVIIEETKGYEKASAYLDSCANGMPYKNMYDAYLIYDFKRNYFFTKQQNYPYALLYADSQLVSIQKMDLTNDTQREILSNSYIKKGLALFNLKRYEEAYQVYYKSKESLAAIKDSCIIKANYSYLYELFGNISYKQKEFLAAAHNFQQSYNIDMDCLHKPLFYYTKQAMLDNVALCYAHANMNDSAYYYYKKALEKLDEFEKNYPSYKGDAEIGRAVVYGNLATLYIKQNKIDSAEILLNQSIAININGEKMDAQITQIKLADLYIDINKISEALLQLQIAKKSLDTIKNEEANLKWLVVKQKYFDKLKQTDSAYEILKQYHILKDSISVNEKYLKETDIIKELKNKDQQHQIELLQKRNQLSNISLLVIIVLFIMCFIISYLIWRNMKQAKKRNDIIAVANTQLEISNKNYGRIMKVMAHDFKTPLARMTAILALLNKKEKYTEEGKKLMELLLKSCKDSLVMIDDLLHTAFEQQPDKLQKEATNINQLLEQCVGLMQFKANEKKQHIVLHAKENITIYINHEKIWRMVLNLLRNASKYSPEGQTITVTSKKDGYNLLITVQDNGIGIPERILPKIFDMFTDAVRPGTNGERPVGIGLSICKQIAELHDGKIWVDREENKGATFYVQLPLL